MRYIPFGPELDGLPHVVIGGRPRPDSALALSLLPGVESPPDVRAALHVGLLLRHGGERPSLQAADHGQLDRVLGHSGSVLLLGLRGESQGE